ncbi:MAG: 2-C-methyl-D-erythritol 2,4-cyclodiphosphate synthase [Candidatus Aureabacteria bacterium]|nr:2-C-methyl-D-erythritol 2,4-cyclodiphosphate synthase [Candidatus Auribacterota bacterium]MCK5654972.1 2-C-methyl-D-erythritol 2,4-cyclodiphosphate synthase [Candidatus Auribacterota bacterium]
MIKVGLGYDVHAFSRDRKLIVGGVEIPYEMGLMGYSDADVLSHAVCDALLGAAGEGDIGKHFPNTDEKYKDICSLELLKKTEKLLKNKNYEIVNVDSVVIAHSPKMEPHVEAMKKNISGALRMNKENVNIKATTTEGLGFTGRREGIAAHAIVSLFKEG